MVRMNKTLKTHQDKWYSKTTRALKAVWASSFGSKKSYNAWVEGIANATGLSKRTIRKSLPAKNYRAAQRNKKKYLNIMLKNIRSAKRSNSWAKNFKAAFKSAGRSRSRRRSSKKKKSSGRSLTPLMKKFERTHKGKKAKWGGKTTKAYRKWRVNRRKKSSRSRKKKKSSGRKLTPLMKKFERTHPGKKAKWGGKTTKAYRKWRANRR